jgi:hypothetical protein
MDGISVDLEKLRRFEAELDPRFPERSAVPTQVLGYGEISTVLAIETGETRNLAYKRLAMFRTNDEAARYEVLYRDYIQVLRENVGLRVVDSEIVGLADARKGCVVVYIVQERLPTKSIGHHAIHGLSDEEIHKLVLATLRQTRKVFSFNRRNQGVLEVGFDGQISNWAILGFDSTAPLLADGEIELVYLDTSTPMLRRDGQEQLDPELFLRSAPIFLVWLLKMLFLEDVMTRYYDFHQVAVDLVANFYKEQRPELVPELVHTVNTFFRTEFKDETLEPVTEDEIRSYYREDVWIWRSYLAARKLDRALHRLLGRDYVYILPGRTKR